MPDAFDRAERWRSRAEELRVIAAEMHERAARESLQAIAGALDEHAGKLEEVLLKVRCVRARAAPGRPPGQAAPRRSPFARPADRSDRPA